MALTWVDTPLTGNIIPGRWYFAQWKLNRKALNDWEKKSIIWAIQTAAQLKGNIKVASVQYKAVVNQLGKADGIMVGVTFQGVYNPNQTSQAGFDPRAVILIIAGILLAVLAANGTLFKFASAVDNATGAVKQALNPLTLVLLLGGALIILPMVLGRN